MYVWFRIYHTWTSILHFLYGTDRYIWQMNQRICIILYLTYLIFSPLQKIFSPINQDFFLMSDVNTLCNRFLKILLIYMCQSLVWRLFCWTRKYYWSGESWSLFRLRYFLDALKTHCRPCAVFCSLIGLLSLCPYPVTVFHFQSNILFLLFFVDTCILCCLMKSVPKSSDSSFNQIHRIVKYIAETFFSFAELLCKHCS